MNDQTRLIKKGLRTYGRVTLTSDPLSRAKQEFRDECDINTIMAKYQKTGIIEHRNKNEPRYTEMNGLDFRESLEQVMEAQDLFLQLPSSLRKRFQNDPGQFYEFVQNPDNTDELIQLGLANAPDDYVPPERRPQAPSEPSESTETVNPDPNAGP